MIKDYKKKKDIELKKLNALLNKLPENKKKLYANLIENLAHMTVVLDDLARIVSEEGASIVYVNGNGFETIQEHPAQKSYNTTIKNYTSAIKQLSEIMPEDEGNALLDLRKQLK